MILSLSFATVAIAAGGGANATAGVFRLMAEYACVSGGRIEDKVRKTTRNRNTRNAFILLFVYFSARELLF